MRWMRRTGAALLVAALVVLMPVGMETPASAAQIPPPVEPAGALASTVVRMTQGGTGSWSVGDYLRAFTYANRSNGIATIPKPVPPVTAPAPAPVSTVPLSKVGAASVAMKGLGTVGFGLQIGGALGGVGITMIGQATGTDFDSSMCTAPDWVQGGYSFFTMGTGPSCKLPFVTANAGVAVGWAGAGYGVTILRYGAGTSGGEVVYFARVKTVDGINHGLAAKGSDGQWYPMGVAKPVEDWAAITTGMQFFRSPGYQLCVDQTVAQCAGPGAKLITPTSTSSDPLRNSRCTLTWPDGSTTTGFVGQYRQSEGFPVGAVSHACTEAYTSKPGAGPDLLPRRISVGDENTETGAKTELAGQDVPQYTEAERKGLTTGDGTGLRLVKTLGATVDSCMTWAADCSGWWAASNDGTSEGTYKCLWGGQAVALAECGIYRRTFDTQTEKPTITDPSTGQQVEWSNTTDPANQFGTGAQSGQSNDRCVTSFSWNPVDWVLRPIRCAAEPRMSEVSKALANVRAAWSNSALGSWATALGSWSFVPPSSGCDGITIPLDQWFKHGVQPVKILNACAGQPLAPIASTSTLVITILSVIGLIRSATRALGGLVGTRGLGD